MRLASSVAIIYRRYSPTRFGTDGIGVFGVVARIPDEGRALQAPVRVSGCLAGTSLWTLQRPGFAKAWTGVALDIYFGGMGISVICVVAQQEARGSLHRQQFDPQQHDSIGPG